MKIDINKDFEEAFPNEVYSGFTLGQCMAAASGMALAFGTAFLMWRFLGIPIVECTYLAIPLMVPVCAIGFFKYQGQSLVGIIREILYSRKTDQLAYSAGEYRWTPTCSAATPTPSFGMCWTRPAASDRTTAGSTQYCKKANVL